MKRKLFSLVLALMLIAGLSISVGAESQLLNVTDDAGVLTDEQYSQLEQAAEDVTRSYDFGVYVVILDDYTLYYDTAYETAYQLYHQYTLGEGSDRNGAILMLSISNRECSTFFYGPQAEYAFDDYGQLTVEEAYLDDFRNDDWFSGCSHFISACGDLLAMAAAGEPLRESPWGTLVVIIGISCLVSIIITLLLKLRMRSVRTGTEASAYVAGDLQLADSSDVYTHTTKTRTKIEKEPDSNAGDGSHSGGGGSGRSSHF